MNSTLTEVVEALRSEAARNRAAETMHLTRVQYDQLVDELTSLARLQRHEIIPVKRWDHDDEKDGVSLEERTVLSVRRRQIRLITAAVFFDHDGHDLERLACDFWVHNQPDLTYDDVRRILWEDARLTVDDYIAAVRGLRAGMSAAQLKEDGVNVEAASQVAGLFRFHDWHDQCRARCAMRIAVGGGTTSDLVALWGHEWPSMRQSEPTTLAAYPEYA